MSISLNDLAQNMSLTHFEVINKLADINVQGYSLSNPSEIELSGSDALANAVLLWLSSERGDYWLDDPSVGGPLYSFIGKPFVQDVAEALASSFQSSFTLMFEDSMFINKLSIQADSSKKVWKLDLEVTDTVGTTAEIQVEVAP